MTPEESLNRRINKLEALVLPPMSLRDWFAGQALAGLLAQESRTGKRSDYAKDAWCLADNMMEQREKQP